MLLGNAMFRSHRSGPNGHRGADSGGRDQGRAWRNCLAKRPEANKGAGQKLIAAAAEDTFEPPSCHWGRPSSRGLLILLAAVIFAHHLEPLSGAPPPEEHLQVGPQMQRQPDRDLQWRRQRQQLELAVGQELALNDSLLMLERDLSAAATGAERRPELVGAEGEADPSWRRALESPNTSSLAASSAQPAERQLKRLLVRRLTDLIMNNEPETIADDMGGAQVSGQMLSETGGSGTQAETVGGPDAAGLASSEIRRREMGAEQAPEEASSSPPGESQGGQEEPMVSCSPDYEDQGAMETNNLTAEQQQQLLAGVDSSGLLHLSNASLEAEPQPDRARPAASQCIWPGNRMIPIITHVIAPILFSIIIVVGLLGNIIVMLVILEDRRTERELTPTNLLIFNLSLADLSFIIFCIPFTAWDYADGHWVFGPLWCKFNQYLIVVCAHSSIYTLVLMSVDRFMAIVFPIECISYRTSRNMLHAIYVKWILILLIASPTVSMHGLVDLPTDPNKCRFLVDDYNPLHFQIIFFITSYLFPLILIFFLYFGLLNKLWFGSKPHGHKESIRMLESKKKVTWLVASIVVVFALCWGPIQVMLILMRLKSYDITPTYIAIQVFAHTLGYMNSCINPIVYAFASETFHQSLKRSWLGRSLRLCCCCCSLQVASNGTLAASQSHHISYRFTGTRHSQAHIMNSAGNSNNNTATLNVNTNNNRVRSLNHIFEPSNSDDNSNGTSSLTSGPTNRSPVSNDVDRNNNNNNRSTNSKNPLPLEPRDRPSVDRARKQQLASQSSQQGGPQVRNQAGPLSSTAEKLPPASQRASPQQQAKTLVPRQPTTSGSMPVGPKQPAKQQLVARIDQSNNQIAHQCEPCDQP